MLLASTSSPRRDQRVDVGERDPLDRHRALLRARPRARCARLELGGEEQVGVLVAEAGRVVELAEQHEPAGAVARSPPRARGARSPRAARRRRRACRPAPRAARRRRRRGTGARAARRRRRSTGTTTTAPGWRTTCRSNSSPSVLRDAHVARRRRKPASQRAARSRRPGTRRVASVRPGARRAPAPRSAAAGAADGPRPGRARRLHERGEQRVRPVGAALELGVGLGADEERVTRGSSTNSTRRSSGEVPEQTSPDFLEPAAVAGC